MKIAIVGLDDNCLEGYDPDEWDRQYHMGQNLWANATDVFEMHDRGHWGHGERLEYLTKTDAVVWSRDRHEDIGSLAFPMVEAVKAVGRCYFECTAAYMIGCAITAGARKIGLYGVSGAAECTDQRANLEFLLGVAQGRGIKIWVHPNSELFTSQWVSGAYGRQDPKEVAA